VLYLRKHASFAYTYVHMCIVSEYAISLWLEAIIILLCFDGSNNELLPRAISICYLPMLPPVALTTRASKWRNFTSLNLSTLFVIFCRDRVASDYVATFRFSVSSICFFERQLLNGEILHHQICQSCFAVFFFYGSPTGKAFTERLGRN
jgi:hypothetical protein